MRKVYLHIGTHKTGTTSLQASLAEAAQFLKQRGIHRTQLGVPPLNGAHHNFAWELSHDSRFQPTDGGLADLLAEIRSTSDDTIISSEEFECAVCANPTAFNRFVGAIAAEGCEVVIVVYLRNQVDYIRSLYFELLKHGLDKPFDDFLNTGIERGAVGWKRQMFALKYDTFLARLQDAPGSRLIVRSYDKLRSSVIEDFYETVLGLPHGAVPVNAAYRLNRSLSVAESFALFCRNRNSAFDVVTSHDLLTADDQIDVSAESSARIMQSFDDANRFIYNAFDLPEFQLERPLRQARTPRRSLNHIFSGEFVDLFLQHSQTLSVQWAAADRLRQRQAEEVSAIYAGLADERAEISSVRIAFEIREREAAAFEVEVKSLRERSSAAEAEFVRSVTRMEAELAQYREHTRVLEAGIVNERAAFEQQRAARTAAEQELAREHDRLTVLAAEAGQNDLHTAELEASLRHVEAERAAFQRALNEARQQAVGLVEEVSALSLQVQVQRVEADSFRVDRSQLESVDARARDAEERGVQLHARIETLLAELRDGRVAVAKLESEQAQYREHALVLEVELENAKADSGRHKAQCATLDSELAQHREHLRLLEAELENEKAASERQYTQRAALESELTQYREHARVLEAELKNSQAGAERQQVQRATLESELAQYREHARVLEAELENAQLSFERQHAQCAALDAELARYREFAEALQAGLANERAAFEQQRAIRSAVESELVQHREHTQSLETVLAHERFRFEQQRLASAQLEEGLAKLERELGLYREHTRVLEEGVARQGKDLTASQDVTETLRVALLSAQTERDALREESEGLRIGLANEIVAFQSQRAARVVAETELMEARRVFAEVEQAFAGERAAEKADAARKMEGARQISAALQVELADTRTALARIIGGQAVLEADLAQARQTLTALELGLANEHAAFTAQRRARTLAEQELAAEREALADRESEAKAERFALENEFNALQSHAGVLQTELDQRKLAESALASQLAALRGSTLWRAIAPLRALRKLFSKR